MYGITFLGKHSFQDMGVTMPGGKEIGIPNKIKNIQRVPFSNIEYDFSSLYGEQVYENRSLIFPFHIGLHANSKEDMNREKTRIVNWLMHSKGKQPLYDDAIPGWHFLAEVEGQTSFQEDWQRGILFVTFTAYPFMIRNVSEGDDMWDTFDFDNDVSQNLTTTSTRGTFKELQIGSYVTVGAYATFFDDWIKISRSRIGLSRKILSKQATTQGTSKWAYELEGLEGLVLEQDIPQSRVNPTIMKIINNGTVSVSPTVVTNQKISVIKGDTVYNFFPGTTKDSVFRLEVGENILTISSIYDANISFEFFKEMI